MNFTYPKNLHFSCSNCGICCGDTPEKARHILLTRKDAKRIAAFTGNAIREFAGKTENKALYIYEMQKRQENGECIFHQNSHCTIYAHRPLICRFYPFELSTAENGKHHFTVTSECPGISSFSSAEEGKVGMRFFRALLQLACAELGFAAELPDGSC